VIDPTNPKSIADACSLEVLYAACDIKEPQAKRTLEGMVLIRASVLLTEGRVTVYDKDSNISGYRDLSPTDLDRLVGVVAKAKLTAASDAIGSKGNQQIADLRAAVAKEAAARAEAKAKPLPEDDESE